MSKTFTSFPTSFKSKTSWFGVEICLALLGSIALSFNIPWQEIFSASHTTGGDTPAHPVLVQGLREAVFSHGQLVHYSASFWGGFEAFQFYFTFPYFVAALLSSFIEPAVAFKLTTIAPVLLLPAAFYFMSRQLGVEKFAATLGSLLTIAFLHTNAHRIWGGSIFSLMTGMLANSWAFVLYAIALGLLVKAREQMKLSPLFVVFGVLTMASHFYTSFLLFLLFLVFVLEDLFSFKRVRKDAKAYLTFYCNGLCVALIMSWWILPLLFYRPFSSAYGANFNVEFLQTFSFAEMFWFLAAILFGLWSLFSARVPGRATRIICCYLLLYLSLYFARDLLDSSIFTNGRLWPGLYFLCFVQLVLFLDWLLMRNSAAIGVLALGLTLFLIPQGDSLAEAKRWMEWNFGGVEARPGAEDYQKLIDVLNELPSGRISFESYPPNHGILGSIRAFEEIPARTKHSIVEGGIVNSATVPGVPYFLQCLSSNSCAGWPPGSLMPEKDLSKVGHLMGALGVQYHIASRPENIKALMDSDQFKVLFEGSHFTLLSRKENSSLVESFAGSALYIKAEEPTLVINQLIRIDSIRQAPVAFLEGQESEDVEPVSPESFLNMLVYEWRNGEHTRARGWDLRTEDERGQVNLYLMLTDSQRAHLEKTSSLVELPPFFLADRSFEPHVIFRKQVWQDREVLAPLLSDESVREVLRWQSRGYQLESEDPTSINWKNTNVNFVDGSVHLWFKYVEHSIDYPYIDLISSPSTELMSGFRQGEKVTLPSVSTAECAPKIEYEFEVIRLETKCPGQPHLVKYSYYPKWESSVPIYRSVNGHMLLIPEEPVTVLRHRRGSIDLLAVFLSGIGVLLLLLLVWRSKYRVVA